MKLPWPWAFLLALLALLLAGTLALDRSTWPLPLLGDEATYLMQAESLAWDLDLHYEPVDYHRFVAHRGFVPEGLILQVDAADAGSTIAFGKPFFYGLYLAPFVRLAPVRGPFVANALLLAAAALAAARTLERRIGRAAPLWVALLIFGSVSFAYTFWVHPDLFLMCLTAIALALVFDPRDVGAGPRACPPSLWRWAAAGLLLAVAAFSRPMYAALFLPAAAAVPAVHRRRAWTALAAGAVGVVLMASAIHQSLAGSWTSYGAVRQGFYERTGFPDVDFPAAEWREHLEEWGNHAWLGPSELGRKKVDAALWAWNSVYFTLGRHVGLVPYFLPLLLALAGRPRGAAAWALLAAVVLVAASFFWLRPFNFWGGGGAIGNRYILPLYPAFWFLPRRPIRPAWIAAAAVASALFVAPLWLRPLAFPLMDGGSYRYVSPVAKAVLPYETTQSHLKPAGRDDVRHQGLWIKFLDRGVDSVREGEILRLRGGGGAILVGSLRPLHVLELEMRGAGDVTLHSAGGVAEELPSEGPWRRFRITLDRRRARHPMWWTWEPFYLYRLRLVLEPSGEVPDRVPFKLRARSPLRTTW